MLDRHEVRQLFLVAAEHADSAFLRARDLAILGLFTQMGLRVHELVALDVAQVDVSSATMLAINGKGGTTHDLPLNAPAIAQDAARRVLSGRRRSGSEDTGRPRSRRGRARRSLAASRRARRSRCCACSRARASWAWTSPRSAPRSITPSLTSLLGAQVLFEGLALHALGR